MNQVSNQSQVTYFDLHATGLGTLKRIRTVVANKKSSFVACSIGAMRGQVGESEWTNFDLRVSGSLAQKQVAALAPSVNEGKRVLVGFKLGDFYPEAFEVTVEGKKEQRLSLKGRLLQIKWAKVDGVDFELPKAEADVKHEESMAA
jgi:hypothetical protein